MSLNAYKISLKFYTSYLNNKLQQIIHSYISLLKYHRKILRNLAGSPSTESLLSQTPPFDRGTSPNNSFDCQLTSTVTTMLNFSMLFLLRNSNVRAILRNPPKYRHKLISFQSSTCAFEVQNEYILKRFLYS